MRRRSSELRAAAELLALAEPPDALFTANNLLGVGALEHLVDIGRGPPTVGLAVLGELPYPTWEAEGAVVQPWPGRLLGVSAADLLLERIRGDTSPPQPRAPQRQDPTSPAPSPA